MMCLRHWIKIGLVGFCAIEAGVGWLEAKTGKSEGADIVFGGQGNGPGEFTILRDITFDPKGDLYTLEAGGIVKAGRDTEYTGTARVQRFSGKGEFLSQFPLGDDLPTDKRSQPARLAVDGTGNVFVTFPQLGFVRQYDSGGKKIQDHSVPGAVGVALDIEQGKERIAIVGGSKILVQGKGWQEAGGDEIVLLDPADGKTQKITLPAELEDVQDLAVNRSGHFYVLTGSSHGIFIYDNAGKPLKVIGGAGGKARNPDGSEPLHSIALDSKDNLYTLTWGNPALVTMYTADGKTVRQHGGQFKFADPWTGGGYAPLAISPDDRIWLASVDFMDPKGPNFAKYHFRPAVLRTAANFLNPKLRAVKSRSTLTLGLAAKIESKLPWNITTDMAPIQTEFVLPASNRNVSEMKVDYHVYDFYKNPIAEGEFKVPLQNNVEARVPITFTPNRYGWYVVEAKMTGGGESLGGVSAQFGVTPRYENMPVKPEEFGSGWNDAPRQMFCGMTNVRLAAPLNGLSTPKMMEAFDKSLTEAEKYGTTLSVQLTDRKVDFTPEKIRPFLEKYKGRIPRYELFNEPNFSMKPEEYVALAQPIYQMIKEIDPKAQVMGPSVCGIQLGWYKAFYAAGGAKVCDILTVHDYEGNESISPEHWRWKFTQLRDLMAKNGDGHKDLWQTERCVSGLQNIGATEGAQAVRASLHYDLLQILGVPPEHNNLYYLNEGGYTAVPSYVWSSNGPHPAALVLRTRDALTRDRHFVGAVDFGPQGNDMFMGLRYEGSEGTLVVLRNLGTVDTLMDVGVDQGEAVETTDAFGNVRSLPVKDGKVSLTIGQLPLYLLLKSGQSATFSKIDLGRNIATSAEIIYSGKSDRDVSLLQNGILESIHAGSPNGDTQGTLIWRGELLKQGNPQYLELRWKSSRTFDAVFVHGIRSDNPFCALLDYDVQAWQGGEWKTVAQVRTPLPPTDQVSVFGGKGFTWVMDNNFGVSQFSPVTSDKLRIVFLRTTYGLAADEVALDGRNIPAVPMLREVEVFAPRGQVSLAAEVAQPNKNGTFEADVATVKVTNNSAQTFQGNVRVSEPEGWNASPSQAPVTVAAGTSKELQFKLTPPTDLPAGASLIDFSLEAPNGATVDRDTLLITVSAPLAIFPNAPGGFDRNKNAQVLGATIKNLTTEAISGTLKVTVTGSKDIPSVETAFGPIDGGGAAHLNVLVPEVNIQEGSWKAEYTTKVNGVVVSCRQDLSQRQWSVVGPFKRDNDSGPSPESELNQNRVDITKDYTDTFGGEQKWRTVPDDGKGGMDLFRIFSNEEEAASYAVTWVFSPRDQRVLLSAAFNQEGKVWVNGQPVISHTGPSVFGWGQEQAPVDLKAGSNLVLVKVAKDSGTQWAFLFDLLDPVSHQRINELSYSPKPK